MLALSELFIVPLLIPLQGYYLDIIDEYIGKDKKIKW